MQSTSHHRDLLVQEKQKMRDKYLAHIKVIFHQIDDDGSGEVSIDEVEQIFEDETMSHLLEALEITAFDARSMFKLLDRDLSGSVDIDEFCAGCLRLKGEARSFDIQCLMFESQRLISKTTGLMTHLEESISALKEVVVEGHGSLQKTFRKSREFSAAEAAKLVAKATIYDSERDA